MKKDYQKPLIDSKPAILTESEIDSIFSCIPQIYKIHQMFQIELRNATKSWDENERIGDVFTGAVSYSVLN